MAIDQYNFNKAAYLAANPDVAASGMDAWTHYSQYGINEGRQAFDLNSINTQPTQFGTIYDPEVGQNITIDYSYEPGHVGHMGFIPDDPNNPEGSGQVKWIPSTFDFTGATYDAKSNNYYLPTGEIVSIDPRSNNVISYIPATPTNVYQNKFGETIGQYVGQGENPKFQGQYIDPEAVGSGYLADPNTKQWIKDAQGNVRWGRPDYGDGGGFANWMTDNGWMLPLAMGAGAGLGAAGVIGGAAEAGAAGAGAAELAGPTYAELGYTGLAEGMAGPTYAELGYTGLNNAEAIAAADAASKGLTGAEALKYINQARQGLGLASALSKLAGGGGTGGSAGSLDLGKLANMLAPKNTYQGLELAQITPKNPFLFTTPGQTQATEGAYDVSGSNMANALRKKNYGIG